MLAVILLMTITHVVAATSTTTDTVVVAIAVSIIAPTILGVFTARQARLSKREDAKQARISKEEDWARQDKVAARAEEAAKVLAASTEAAAEKAAEAARTLAARTEEAATKAALAAEDLRKAQADSIARTDEAAKILAERTEEAASKAAQAAVTLAERTHESAQRSEQQAALLLAAQANTTAQANEVARLTAEAKASTDKQLAEIAEQGVATHLLVNSDMTAAKRDVLISSMANLATLRRVAAMSEKLGLPVDEADVAAMEALKVRIDDLRDLLEDRKAQQHIVDEKSGKVHSAKEMADAKATQQVIDSVTPEDVPDPITKAAAEKALLGDEGEGET